MFKLWTNQILDIDQFEEQHCYCTCLCDMFEVNYLKENIISVQQLPLCLPLFFVFLSEVLKSGIKSCFGRVAFQDAVIMLYLCVAFLFHKEFPYAFCCKDCKNVIGEKKFLQSRLFCLFFSFFKFPTEI